MIKQLIMLHQKTLRFLVLYEELALKTALDFYLHIVLWKKNLQSESHYYLFSEITMQYDVPNFADRQKMKEKSSQMSLAFW